MPNNFNDPDVTLLLNFENNLTDEAKGQTVDNDGVTFSSGGSGPKQGTYYAQFDHDTATIQYANLDADMPLTSTGSGIMTICFWIYQSGNQVAGTGLIAGRYDYGGDGIVWALLSHLGDEELWAAISPDGSGANQEVYDTNYKLYQNRWLHVSFRYNNSTKAYAFRIWDDVDQAIECTDSGSFANNTNVAETTDFTIGQHTDESTNALVSAQLDELVIFDRWLTDDEIDDIRNGTYNPSGGPRLMMGANF